MYMYLSCSKFMEIRHKSALLCEGKFNVKISVFPTGLIQF
jgi:hypothetical protein